MRGINDYNDFLQFAMGIAILVLVIFVCIVIICMIKDEFFNSNDNEKCQQ